MITPNRRGHSRLGISTTVIGILLAVLVVSTPEQASAAIVTYATPVGSTTGGQPVNASATFTTGAGTIHIDLVNAIVDPKSVVQNVSDLKFTVSTGQNTGTLTGSSALERTVNSGGSYSNGSLVSSGWSLTTLGSALYLNVLGTAIGPAHTLIGSPDGSNVYGNANGSIAGNGPHNPFLFGTLAFDLAVPGVTASSTISSAIFSFGTTQDGNLVTGAVVPVPAAVWLFGTGLVGLGRLLRVRQG